MWKVFLGESIVLRSPQNHKMILQSLMMEQNVPLACFWWHKGRIICWYTRGLCFLWDRPQQAGEMGGPSLFIQHWGGWICRTRLFSTRETLMYWRDSNEGPLRWSREWNNWNMGKVWESQECLALRAESSGGSHHVSGSPALEILKGHLDMVMGSLL